MVALNQLLDCYGEAELFRGNKSLHLQGISEASDLRPYHLVYIKNKKFFKTLCTHLEKAEQISSNALVIEQALFKSLSEEEKDFLKNFGAMVLVPSVDHALCAFSKPFYDQIMGEKNFTEDGLSRGSALVDKTATIATGVFVGPQVKIGKNVRIMSGACIMGESSIGDDSIIFPNTIIYPRVEIGKKCRIHAQVTIGADGFGYNFINGEHRKIWHFGGVKIGDHVEIGANSCIDGGTFRPTVIGNGVKIDNHVQVGHNVKLGDHVILCGHVALAGSSELADYCVLGGKSGLGPGVKLGQGVQLAGGGLANRDWPAGSQIAGYPAFEIKNWLRSVSKFKKLGDREKRS